jgi:ribosome production factor 2
MRQPKQNTKRKVKNKSTNVFGETIGRLHLERQDIDRLQGKKSKALRLADKAVAEEERAALAAELEREKSQMNDEFQQTHGFAIEDK